jgi:LysM domain
MEKKLHICIPNLVSMRKFLFSFLCLVIAAQFTAAQKGDLLVKSSDKGLYLDHKVVAKESFFSIGRLYNVHPKHLASFNKLDMNKGLLIDQKLKIPLSDTNFTQKGNKGTPVYYKADDDMSLMKVSKENNDVLLADLRGWNGVSDDKVKKNSKLIVGFLQSKEMPAITITRKVVPDEPVVKELNNVKPPPEENQIPVEVVKPVVKEAEKTVEIKRPAEVAVPKVDVRASQDGEGYFKSHFEQQIKKSPVTKDATVTAGIFKTTTGWQDSKFYLLIDAVAPGTIVKVINPTNNKAIYAKVLGEMSGIRQNEGLNIRISNAAASVLAISEQDKFIVKVNY